MLFRSNKIQKIINNKKYTIGDKTENIRLILYKLVDRQLYDKYNKIISSKNITIDEETDIDVDEEAAEEEVQKGGYLNTLQEGGKYDKLVHLSKEEPNLNNYVVNNDRESCNINKNRDECNENIHCHWTRTGCYMSLTKKWLLSLLIK